MLSPDGRVVMISGAARGIGRAIAAHLSAEGYSLSLGVRDPSAATGIVRGLPADRWLIHDYDARLARSAGDWVAATASRFGRIDGVVANAGILKPWAVDTGNEADLDAMWDVNLKGPWRLIAAAWRELKAGGAGRVVTVASMSGRRVKSASSTGYAVSKFALVALTEGVRHSGWAHGIRATAICPGYVATDMSADARTIAASDMTQPETIARLVALALALPNEAALPALAVNCVLEPM